jgi:hypothetical protein
LKRRPGEGDVGHFALSPLAKVDHFADLSKMILGSLASVAAGGFCLGDNDLEVAPLGIAKEFLEFARQPERHAVLLAGAGLETLVKLGDEFLFHVES